MSRFQHCHSSLQLKTYQLAIVKWLIDHNDQKGLIVEYGTGTGKTLLSANVTAVFLNDNRISNVVIVCPKAVIPGFTMDIMKCTEGSVNVKKNKLPLGYSILSYETFSKNKANLVTNKTLLIVDEAHNLRNVSTARSKSIYEAAKRAKYVLFLTATPFINKPSDISWAMRILSPKNKKNFPKSQDVFAKMYDNAPQKYIKNMKNQIAVYHADAESSTKPKTTFHEMKINLSAKQVDAIDKIRRAAKFSYSQVDQIMKQLAQTDSEASTSKEKTQKNINAFLGKVRQASNGLDSKNPCTSKVKALVQKAIRGPKPVLIYSQFKKHGIELVKDCLLKNKVPKSKIAVFTGSLSVTSRRNLIKDYNDRKIDYLLLTSAGSEGVDLKATRQIHILEPYWNPARMEQVFGRGVRLTSHLHLPEKQRHVDLYVWLGVVNANQLKKQGVSSDKAKELSQFSPDERLFSIAEGKKKLIDKYKALNLKASIPTTFEDLLSSKTSKSKKPKKSRKTSKSKKPKKSRKTSKSKKPKKSRKTSKSKKPKKSRKTSKSKKPVKSRKTSKSTKSKRCRKQSPPCPQGCNRVKESSYNLKSGKSVYRRAHCRFS